jgi:hypothetical protein
MLLASLSHVFPVSFFHVAPICSSPLTFESCPDSYERKDLADWSDAIDCANLYAAFFFPCHSFSLLRSLFPIVSQVLSRRRPRSFLFCTRSQTDAETETAIISIHLVSSDRSSRSSHSSSIPASSPFYSWEDPCANLDHRLVTCVQKSLLAR